MSFPPLVEPADELTIDEVRRYSRHLIIPDVGMTGQKRLKNAKVLVIGAGGLGSPRCSTWPPPASARSASPSSTRSTSPTCSARSSTASPTSGSPRPSRPRSPSPRPTRYVEVVAAQGAARQRQRLQVFEGYDLIVDGTDNFATRYMVNDAAYFLEHPLRVGLDLPLRRPGVGVLADRSARTRRATAASTPSRRRRAWSRAAPRAACWACCAPASARSRSTRRSS